MQIIMGFNFPLKRNAKETAGFDRYTTYCSARIHLLRFEKSLTKTFPSFLIKFYTLNLDFLHSTWRLLYLPLCKCRRGTVLNVSKGTSVPFQDDIVKIQSLHLNPLMQNMGY